MYQFVRYAITGVIQYGLHSLIEAYFGSNSWTTAIVGAMNDTVLYGVNQKLNTITFTTNQGEPFSIKYSSPTYDQHNFYPEGCVSHTYCVPACITVPCDQPSQTLSKFLYDRCGFNRTDVTPVFNSTRQLCPSTRGWFRSWDDPTEIFIQYNDVSGKVLECVNSISHYCIDNSRNNILFGVLVGVSGIAIVMSVGSMIYCCAKGIKIVSTEVNSHSSRWTKFTIWKKSSESQALLEKDNSANDVEQGFSHDVTPK